MTFARDRSDVWFVGRDVAGSNPKRRQIADEAPCYFLDGPPLAEPGHGSGDTPGTKLERDAPVRLDALHGVAHDRGSLMEQELSALPLLRAWRQRRQNLPLMASRTS